MMRVLSQVPQPTFSLADHLARAAAQLRVGFSRLRGRVERRLIGDALLRSLADRDTDTALHCGRVARFGGLIADQLRLPDGASLEELRLACLLHDLGKLHVPLHVLHKPGELDEEEWSLMRAHAEGGERIVAASLSRGVARIVGQHHERMDGRGYPNRLPGAAITLEARIVAVADAFDAMTSDRPYRKALAPEAALAELRRSAGLDGAPGGQFDPEIVRAFEARFADAAAICGIG
jgi:HD-GYP domain-containing protein (c-di-GMP phosphodiesterase class II)